MVEIQDVIFLS